METKIEIKGREEVFQLVSMFYSRIREDEGLGPIFNRMLPTDEIWASHLQKLTDFWDANLFGVMNFKGNPMAAHKGVDKEFKFEITQDHFYEWLKLWNSTIDNNFIGEKSELAKEKARRMSTHLYVNMWRNKPENLLDT